MLTFVLKTIEDDSISGDKVHGGYISALTGLEVLAGGPGVDINAGRIDGTKIGVDVPETGRFITLAAVGLSVFVPASITCYDEALNKSVEMLANGNYGTLSLYKSGVINVRLSAESTIPNYFLTKVIVGSSTIPGTVQGAAAILNVVGNLNVTANMFAITLGISGVATFYDQLMFDTSLSGLKSLREFYDHFLEVETWFESLSSDQQDDLVDITHPIYTQLKNIGSYAISAVSWYNLSASGANSINAATWLNLYNSMGHTISEPTWILVETMQDVSTSGVPAFKSSSSDSSKLIHRFTIPITITGVTTAGTVDGDLTYTIIGDPTNANARICSCIFQADNYFTSDESEFTVRPTSGDWPSSLIPSPASRRRCPITMVSNGTYVNAILLTPLNAAGANSWFSIKPAGVVAIDGSVTNVNFKGAASACGIDTNPTAFTYLL